MESQSKLIVALTSQVGRKYLTGITGVLLVIFIIGHLLGNLQLLDSDPERFNAYAKSLHDFGLLLYIIEIALAGVILLHAFIGIAIFMRKLKARKHGYKVSGQKQGGNGKQSLASRSMIYTGIVLLIFLVVHIAQFRFGPAKETVINNEPAMDLHALVMETFSNIWWVIFYVGVMVLIGFHLRHGIWSALQSLGAMKPRWSKAIHGAALIIGLLLAIGFLVLPIIIYVRQV
ncbi:MAG: succinate dehydrogenase cytochrome b subunit [Chlorobi bacterium]|nr:succinate dehydrogenase cytochrome b subunit [Chlorobiota bacterium]